MPPPVIAGLRQQAEFVAYATGDLGTSWCQFRLAHQVTAERREGILGDVPPPTVVQPVSGWNCHVIDTPQVALNRMVLEEAYGPRTYLSTDPYLRLGSGASPLKGFRFGFNNHFRIPNLTMRYASFVVDNTLTAGYRGLAWVNEGEYTGENRRMVGSRLELQGDARNDYDIYYKGAIAGGSGWTQTRVGDQTLLPDTPAGQAPAPLTGMQVWLSRRVRPEWPGTSSLFGGIAEVATPNGPRHLEMSFGQLGVLRERGLGDGFTIRSFIVRFNEDFPIPNLGIRYWAYVFAAAGGTDYETPWVSGGNRLSSGGGGIGFGTVAFELTGTAAPQFDVFYEVYNTQWGWSPMCRHGQPCGTFSRGNYVENIRVWVARKMP